MTTICPDCRHPDCEHGDCGCAHPMPDWAVCHCTSTRQEAQA